MKLPLSTLVSDSTWVSPIHVVSKKTGMTVVKNKKGKMVQTRVQMGGVGALTTASSLS